MLMARKNSYAITFAFLIPLLYQCQSFSPNPVLRNGKRGFGRKLLTNQQRLFRQSHLAGQNDSETQSQNQSKFSPSARTKEQDRIQAEAESALQNVGWSLPEEGALTADDPFVQAIDAGIQADIGVALDDLLNPAKVVNLERDLYSLRQQLATATGVTFSANSLQLDTADCDGGGGGEAADTLRKTISKKEADLFLERRSVFRGWLKTVFLVQAVLSFGISYVMATQPDVLFGGFNWFHSYNMDVSIQVLGYWWWWLFVVPSLRSRRPKGLEKRALDVAFLATPLVSLVAPVFTKDTGLIWTANLAVVTLCYAWSYVLVGEDNINTENVDESSSSSSQPPGWLKFIYKSLDFGSGRERGARK